MIAWLLRTSRLYSRDERLAGLARFAAGFPGGSWPGPASVSQISRWETGAARAGFAVLRRYEQLLGLPAGRLTTIADWAYRKESALAGPPVLDRGLDPADPQMRERTGALLDRALSADLMTGADWDELTCHLAALPVVFLYPATAWDDLVHRLLAELLVADGPAWLLRTESLARLMGHPRARAQIIAACAALADDPANQVVVEPLTIMEVTASPDAARHVLRHLAHPVSDRTLRGALLAAVEKVPRGHFRAAQLPSLANAAVSLLAAPDDEHRHLAAELVRLLSIGQTGQLRLPASQPDPATRAVLDGGQLAPADTAGHVVAEILATVTAELTSQPAISPDPTLERLLRDLLFSPNQNRRLLAGQLIAASPYRNPVGAAVAAQLAITPAARAVPLTTALIAALPCVGRPADRLAVERLVTASALPAPLTNAAAWAIGHVPGRSDNRFWLTAITTHARTWRRTRDPAALSTLCGLTYALGIGRHDHLLRSIRADSRLPAPTRSAANWWLGIPVYVKASAAR